MITLIVSEPGQPDREVEFPDNTTLLDLAGHADMVADDHPENGYDPSAISYRIKIDRLDPRISPKP